MPQPLYPCLWFDGQAQEAAAFYCNLFRGSRITAATPMVAKFELCGQPFMALNGGAAFQVNPSISFFVICETAKETQLLWDRLLAEGSVLMPMGKYDWSEQYGWLQDRYGVSWQIARGDQAEVGQAITPSLLFTGAQHGRAEAALHFYTSLFAPATVDGILKYGPGQEEPAGTVQHAQFRINGYTLMVMDSQQAHRFAFNEAISFVLECKDQAEIDRYWSLLTEGGEEGRCGWLKDRFGVSWQVIPEVLGTLMGDPVRAQRVAQAFMQMKKMDIEVLEKA